MDEKMNLDNKNNLNKYFKYITKIDDNTWFIQHDKNSICESFYFHILPNNRGVLIYGDYDVCYIEPSSKVDNIVGWLSGCTCLSYFCEKVSIANSCKCIIKEFFNNKFMKELKEYLADYADCLKDGVGVNDILEQAERIENQYEAIEFLQENDFEVSDCYDFGMDYTYSIKNQHRFMVWFANKLKKMQEMSKKPNLDNGGRLGTSEGSNPSSCSNIEKGTNVHIIEKMPLMTILTEDYIKNMRKDNLKIWINHLKRELEKAEKELE
jgi:hypothetical protein